MDNGEIIQRVVGVLVETGEYKRALIENPDREESDDDTAVISGLVGEVLRTELAVPADATLEDFGVLVGKALGPVVYQLLGGFALAFHELAEVHDAGQTDVSSAEVLRRLALKAEGL
jgi:hypothetical protein